MQIIINILIQVSIILQIAISFSIIYRVTHFFNITHAIYITFPAYILFLFSHQMDLSFWFSVPLVVFATVALGVFTELFFFKPIHIKNNSSFTLLILSLGFYIVFQNIISLLWGDATLTIRIGETKTGYLFFGANITKIQVITIAVCFLVVAFYIFLLKFTKLGIEMRAVSSNSDLAVIFGINLNRVIIWAFTIGSGMAAIVGILVAFDNDMRPKVGFNLLLYGVIAMIIGGAGNIWGIVCGSFLLVTAQNIVGIYVDNKWMDAIAYIILILFLIMKPSGFTGKKHKKIGI